MAHETLQAIIGTAIVDSTFRRSLLSRAPGVLSSFELTAEESEIVHRIQADTLQGFAREIQDWLNQKSTARIPSPTFSIGS